MAPIARRAAHLCRAVAVVAAFAGILPARVDAACRVSVSSGVSFGTYNVFSGAPLDSVGQVTWRCDFLTFPTVRITLTRGSSSSFRPRTMVSGANTLGYNLYRDSGRTVIWGDETDGTQAYYQRYQGWGTYTLTIYGRIPADQDAAVGSYSDTVTVVINF